MPLNPSESCQGNPSSQRRGTTRFEIRPRRTRCPGLWEQGRLDAPAPWNPLVALWFASQGPWRMGETTPTGYLARFGQVRSDTFDSGCLELTRFRGHPQTWGEEDTIGRVASTCSLRALDCWFYWSDQVSLTMPTRGVRRVPQRGVGVFRASGAVGNRLGAAAVTSLPGRLAVGSCQVTPSRPGRPRSRPRGRARDM